MTYLIGDRTISLGDATLSPEDEQLIRAHPRIFKYCLNSTAQRYLLALKSIVHLYTDIVTIYSTLLSKIANYDDLRCMATKTRVGLTSLESDLHYVFGNDFIVAKTVWEEQNYDLVVRQLAQAVLGQSVDMFEQVSRFLSCVEVFFGSFDNLKKLLVPCLRHTEMVQKSVLGAACCFKIPTIVGQLPNLPVITPTVVQQLRKVDTITSGLEREAKLLEMVFASIDPTLQQYTLLLLGKAILKRDVTPGSCRLITRRDVCYQAAEHVVSIPLTGAPAPASYMHRLTKHVVYFFSALLVVVLAVLYRLYNVVFG
ncbi:hypothetical protein OXX80_007606 [Metschnikowia pulcherrima]